MSDGRTNNADSAADRQLQDGKHGNHGAVRQNQRAAGSEHQPEKGV